MKHILCYVFYAVIKHVRYEGSTELARFTNRQAADDFVTASKEIVSSDTSLHTSMDFSPLTGDVYESFLDYLQKKPVRYPTFPLVRKPTQYVARSHSGYYLGLSKELPVHCFDDENIRAVGLIEEAKAFATKADAERACEAFLMFSRHVLEDPYAIPFKPYPLFYKGDSPTGELVFWDEDEARILCGTYKRALLA